MKKILLILVGGTICTSVNEKGTLTVNGKMGLKLKENFEKSDSVYAKDVEFTLTENLFILSENMTIENWNLIIDTYRKYIKREEFDGVIFAHGTDTLAYSASLFSFALANTKIPVFFVSSNKHLDNETANGNDNFKCAVECICRDIEPNVYVTYKNISDNKMYLHLASHIEQCKNYSDDFFSNDAINITDISEENYKKYFEIIGEKFPQNKRKAFIDINEKWHLKNNVLLINPYVGIDYTAYEYSKFSAVLHGCYHSGTACAEGDNSIIKMIDICSSQNIDTYISPSKPEGEVYDTVRIIASRRANGKNINFVYGCTNEALYAKLVLAYSVFKDVKIAKVFTQTECNFEFSHK